MTSTCTWRGGGSGWMLLALYVLTLLTPVVLGSNSSKTENGQCVPWICSCYYYGNYFDEGDIWKSKDDPCTSYKCIENGVFIPINQGCSFMGKCKPTNSTWSHGCFQFKCDTRGTLSNYRLTQTACMWKDGNCYAVGQRVSEYCDTYECQLDHGCYVMNKVKSGCKTGIVKQPCKPMFSFWQDECAIYQCSGENNDRLKARILTHSHDVMMWPRGHYALPEPLEGCPNYGEHFWRDGWHKQCGDGCNFKSTPFNLKGNYTGHEFDHHFCVHHDINDPTVIPVYQTHWGPGKYCILKYNGTCPRGFSEGYVEMTNNNCNPASTTTMPTSTTANTTTVPSSNFTDNTTTMPDGNFTMNTTTMPDGNFTTTMLDGNFTTNTTTTPGGNFTAENVTTGFLPDGEFTTQNTRLEFCCRNDGEIKRPIVLPAKHPFVLFMAANETSCQEVTGMRHDLQFWSFCDAHDGVYRQLNGSLPFLKTGDNNTLINFCYYVPIGCGCTDGDEDIVAIGDKVTRDCVTRECRQILKYNVLAIIKGGCYDKVNKKCQLENTEWTDTIEQTCLHRKCIRKVNNVTEKVHFEIVNVGKGCRNNGGCVALNFTKVKGCYHTQCQEDVTKQYATWQVTLAGCSDGHGKCIPEGKVVKQGCLELQCNKSLSTCGLSVKKGACGLQNGTVCYDEEQKFNLSCTEYQCKKIVTENYMSWTINPLKPGCSDGHDKCYSEGDRINGSCISYECMLGKRPGFYPVWRGCNTNIGCIPPNGKLEHRCSVYNCTKFENGTLKFYREARKCSYNGTCYSPGSTVENKKYCMNMTCQADGTMKRTNMGCGFKDKCYLNNQDIVEGCSTYRCYANATHRWIKHIQLACKVDGKCIDPGVVYKKDCNTFKCSEDKKSCASHLVEYGCSDTKTKACLKRGDITRHGCSLYTCSPNGTQNPYVFKSGDCPYKGKCYKVGSTFPYGDCGSGQCGHKTPGDTSSPLVIRLSKGCIHNGKCLKKGEGYWDKAASAYYCYKMTCHYGKMYRTGLSCKAKDKKCVVAERGKEVAYTMVHSNKQCSAICYWQGNSIKIKITSCS